MKSPQTSIGSRMACSDELSDFRRGTVIGCHLSNKSVCRISALLELPRSTVGVVIVKWKHLGATVAQLRSGRPHKLTEWERRVLKRVARKHRLSLVTEFQTASGSNVSTITVCRELHGMVSMAEQLHTSLRSPCAMPSIGWSGLKLTAVGLWSSGNAFSGVTNYASPSGTPSRPPSNQWIRPSQPHPLLTGV